MNPVTDVEALRKAFHEVVDGLTGAELYSLGDGVIITRHASLDKRHYVSIMLAANKKYKVE